MRRRLIAITLAAAWGLTLPVFLTGSQTDRTFDPENRIVKIVASNGRVTLTNMGSGPPTEVFASEDIRTPGPQRFAALIDRISGTHGVDPALTRAVIEVESNFNPLAVSTAGALGLMQLIPSTGERFGVNNFFDPADNIEGGVRFLSLLIDKFGGNLDLVLAAYNAGENLVERLGRIPAIPETEDYVRKVRAAYGTPTQTTTDGERQPSDNLTAEPGMAPTIFRSVNERGVPGFSSVGPNR